MVINFHVHMMRYQVNWPRELGEFYIKEMFQGDCWLTGKPWRPEDFCVTVERLIHGLHAHYNKVPIWDYGGLAKVFGPSFPSKYHGPVKTCEQLASLLASPNFGKGDVFEVRSRNTFRLWR